MICIPVISLVATFLGFDMWGGQSKRAEPHVSGHPIGYTPASSRRNSADSTVPMRRSVEHQYHQTGGYVDSLLWEAEGLTKSNNSYCLLYIYICTKLRYIARWILPHKLIPTQVCANKFLNNTLKSLYVQYPKYKEKSEELRLSAPLRALQDSSKMQPPVRTSQTVLIRSWDVGDTTDDSSNLFKTYQ